MYKKCWTKVRNMKYVVMTAVLVRNICIHFHHPCRPQWKVTVEQLSLLDNQIDGFESSHSKSNSLEISRKISSWLWNQK